MTKRVLTIGGATQDIFLLYKNIEILNLNTEFEKRTFIILEEGRKIEINALKYYTGGGATNSAASFKKLQFSVAPVCKVGKDSEATFILNELVKLKIDIDHIVQDPNAPTSTAFIIPTKTADRTVLVYRGASRFLNHDDLPAHTLDSTDLVYITSLTGESSKMLPYITKRAKSHNCQVATNPGTSQLRAGADMLRDSLPYIDIFILNSTEARYCMASLIKENSSLQKAILLTDINADHTDQKLPELLKSNLVNQGICFSLRTYFRAILERGPHIAVVTNGAEGVYVATEEKILFHPSINTTIVNTIGAGDAFGSCFVAYIAHDATVEEALQAGIINATSVIGYLDTKSGLLTKAQIEEQLKRLNKNNIQQFSL